MRKILFILSLLVCSVVCFGQPIVNRAGSANTVQDGRLSALYNLYVPKYSDTTAANLQVGIDSLSAVIFTYNTMSLWVRSIVGGGKRWVEIGSGGGGSVTASEGLLKVLDDIQLGGPLGSAAPLLTNRQIDLNGKLLYFTKGVPTPDYTAFDDRYTPFNVNILDSITSDSPDYDIVPKSGGNFQRTFRYFPPAYKLNNRYGWRMALETQVGDSVVERSDGGDYYAALIAEHQISPIEGHTGRSVVRSGHGGFSYNFAHEGIPSIIANMFIDGTDTNKYIYYKGFLTGVRSYLATSGNGGADTIENVSYYAASSFVNSPAWVKRSYVLRPEATHNRSAQPFFLYDSTRRQRSFHAGNLALGPGVDSSDYKLDVRGTGRFSDTLTLSSVTNTDDSTGYDILLRRRSGGAVTRMSVDALSNFISSGGGSSLFPTTGTGTATGGVIGDLDGNVLEVQQGGNGLLVLDPTSYSAFLRGTDGTGDTRLQLQSNVTDGDVNFRLRSDDDNNAVEIIGDAVANTLEYSAGSNTFTGNILTSSDNTYDIGDATNSFKDIYGRTVHLDGSTSGGVTIQSDALGNAINGTTLSGTGFVPATMFARLTSANPLADNTTDQNAFSSALDTWTLQGSTTYEVEGLYIVNSGGTNHNTQIGFTLGGGASITSISYYALNWTTATAQPAQVTTMVTVATATAVTLFNNATVNQIYFKGYISMNAGGTVAPFVKFSVAPGGSNEVAAGSYIKFTPIGTGTMTSIGSVN